MKRNNIFNLQSLIIFQEKQRPRGPMDKASAYRAGDCRFESCRGHLAICNCQFAASSAMAQRATPPSIVGDQLRAPRGWRLLGKVLAHASDPQSANPSRCCATTMSFAPEAAHPLVKANRSKEALRRDQTHEHQSEGRAQAAYVFPTRLGGGVFEKSVRRRRCPFFSWILSSGSWERVMLPFVALRRVSGCFLSVGCAAPVVRPCLPRSRRKIFWNGGGDES